MLMAKESLMDPIDMQELIERGPKTNIEKMRIELYEKVNRAGHRGAGAWRADDGAGREDHGLSDACGEPAGGDDSELRGDAPPAHPAGWLGAGDGLRRRRSMTWPKLVYDVHNARRVDLNTVTKDEVKTWKPGEVVLLSGKLLTGRDAAHKRLTDMLNRGEKLPVDFRGRFIYYVGPVEAVRDEAVGPAGPTTATRMDKFTRQMLEATGLLGMIGKAERGPAAIDAIRDNEAVYLMAVGGAAYLVSKAIRSSKVLAFADLGMEAIYEFEVQDMPVTVAVDAQGTSVHVTGPAEWSAKIAQGRQRAADFQPVGGAAWRIPADSAWCLQSSRRLRRC